ncbi:MAG: hypothetical protein NVS3B20_00430 [Polyangiales bacterium]
MIFLATLTYRVPLETVEENTADHRAFCREHFASGTLIASGPFTPREGGLLIVRAASRDEVDAMLADDPFLSRGIATYEVRAWTPVLGSDLFARSNSPE